MNRRMSKTKYWIIAHYSKLYIQDLVLEILLDLDWEQTFKRPSSNKSCNYSTVFSGAYSSCCFVPTTLAVPVESLLWYTIFMFENCKADVYSCENATDYNFNITGNKNFQKHTAILPWDLGKWRRWSWFHPQDETALYHVAFLATVLSASAWVCAHFGWCVFVCVLSPTDISSNVVDISRGFEDLIPSVFEELCAALLTTLRKALQQSQQRALPSGPYSTAFWAARSHSPVVWSGEDLHYTLPAFSKWLVHCLVFYLVLLFSPELWSVSASLKWGRKAITKRYERRKQIEMVWEGVKGRISEKVWDREGEIRFSCYRLVSGAKWHRLTSLFHGD